MRPLGADAQLLSLSCFIYFLCAFFFLLFPSHLLPSTDEIWVKVIGISRSSTKPNATLYSGEAGGSEILDGLYAAVYLNLLPRLDLFAKMDIIMLVLPWSCVEVAIIWLLTRTAYQGATDSGKSTCLRYLHI